jgi:hypothetical protein
MEKNIAVVELGYGKVGITNFNQDGDKGILLAPFEEAHKIGESMDGGPYQCVGGEVFIVCYKKESALVLLEQVQKLVDSFD